MYDCYACLHLLDNAEAGNYYASKAIDMQAENGITTDADGEEAIKKSWASRKNPIQM